MRDDADADPPAPARSARLAAFAPFVFLYAALYGAFRSESPFLPAFLGARGLDPSEIGLVLAAGTIVRLAAGPVAGSLADRYDAARTILGASAALAGLVAFAYLGGAGVLAFLAISMAHSVVVAPLAPLADALALAAASRRHAFTYGAVRGVGSGAFVLGTLASGQLVKAAGLSSIIVSSGALLLAMAAATRLVPPAQVRPEGRDGAGFGLAGARTLLAIPAFRRMLLVAALVIGSHALNDAFAVIRWREAGISPGIASALWAESVASEVAVFLLIGPWLLARLGPARCAALAAALGALRWGVLAQTTAVPVLAAIQLSHGITFALLHLANMQLIAAVVPERLGATAQTLYGTLGLGVASAILTAASGVLYGAFGAGAFWAMAALCLVALPLTARLVPQADA